MSASSYATYLRQQSHIDYGVVQVISLTLRRLLPETMYTVSAEDYETTVKEFNETDDPSTLRFCLHQILEQVAESNIDKIALRCANKALTFGELNAFANRFARVLVQRGIRNGDLIGVALDRSVDLVVVLLAVLKTGATYVPIDPAFPAKRLKQMMDDACPKLLIASGNTLE